MKRPLRWTPVLALLALAGLACDSANPVAPSGTILTISAEANRIELNGSTTITVVGRQPNGNPLNPGTEIQFSASLGAIDPVIGQADENGIVRTTLSGDGRAGTATVQATAVGGSVGGDGEGGGGSSGATASIDVEIGRGVGSVSLQATPASVPESGATVQLLALVRDQDGEPQSNISVNFRAQLGVLDSGGSFVQTDATGQATDTLTLAEGDLNSISGDSFTASVQAAGGGGGGEGAVRSDEVSISILRRPEASFTTNRNGLTVVFQDTSSGNPTSWTWSFGDGSPAVSVQNPTHTYDDPGQYTVTLRVRNSAGTSQSSQVVTVSADS